MTDTNLMALPSPLSNLRQYIQLVESFPRLEKDEECALAERLHRDNDLDAAMRLITSHLRYVVYIARGYAGYGLSLEDLVQEGNIGLMRAVRRFDPSRGVRLVIYAAYWIRAHMHDYILKNWRIVKVATTKAKRKLFYKLRGAKKRLEWLNQAEADEIANTLRVSSEDVVEMESTMYRSDQSFDAPADPSNADGWVPADYLQDTSQEPFSALAESDFLSSASVALQDALDTLDARSRDIIESRWLCEGENKATLENLGRRYGISAERVRQIEVVAIEQLREKMGPRLGVDRCEIALPRKQNVIAV